MPNWCDNVLEVSHEDPKQIDRIVQAFNDQRLCDEFIPVPEALKGSTADGSVNADLQAKTGYSDWYSFCVNEWGTKWDVGGEDGYASSTGEKSVQLSFMSAWSPPMGLYHKLREFGFTVKAYYYEPGMGFAGIYDDGFDEEFSTEDELPAELDEMFGISESREEYDD